jgi:PAS domain S-box-containing protein
MDRDDHLAGIGRLAFSLVRTAARATGDVVDELFGNSDRPASNGSQAPRAAAPSPPPTPPATPGPTTAANGNGAVSAHGLAESEILEHSTNAFVAMAADGTITAWNRAAESTFGWTVEEAIGREMADTIVPESFRGAHRSGLARYLETGEAKVLDKRLEMTALHRDGREFPVEMTISALGEGKSASFYAFLHDISERVESERFRGAQLQIGGVLAGAVTLEDAMPAALQAIGEAFGFHAGAFWRLNEQGNLRCQVFWSDADDVAAFEESTRGIEVAPGEDLPGVALADRTATWVRKVAYDPDFSRSESARQAGLESALASPLVRDEKVYGVIELLTTSGQPPKPEALDALAVITSQMAEFSARMVEQDAERLKDEFFALVSHELRTPLTSIIGYTDMLAKKEADGLSDRGLKMLEVIRRNAGREMRLVGDLLMLVRIKAGRFELEPGTVGLRFVVDEAVDAARPAAERQGLDLKLRAEEVTRFPGDSERLGQVVDNLLSNAIKFTDEGSVEVRVFEDGEAAVVEVQDSGPGIPPEDIELLFDRLYRASSATAGHIPGAGLGLTIVKGIVEAHGGRVLVESEVGSGTTFRAELPLTKAAGNLAISQPAINGNGAMSGTADGGASGVR